MKNTLRLIYKIDSKMLKKEKWNLKLQLNDALAKYPESIVSIATSQAIRFIDAINGISDADAQIAELKARIKHQKQQKKSAASKKKIKQLYKQLYQIQFIPDYVCVVMDKLSDYDRANKGFTINGIGYKRLLGTNGGIKHSTIIYVSQRVYNELKKKMDNGRNMEIPLVPAKLEAYQALICSGSIPLPVPKGIIVVNDCITHFIDDVILIDTDENGIPHTQEVNNYHIEHNNSDGFGMMTPEYSRRVNELVNGNSEMTISGVNTRYAFTKGMIYTFDFIEFAEKVAGTYEVIDVWGNPQDVRKAEVILTASMLKLWHCYNSFDDFKTNCDSNGYQFSMTKNCLQQLENTRTTNYQFLQSYHLSDADIAALCQPSISEIQDVLGGDYRKSIAFLAGFGLNTENVWNQNAMVQALMIAPEMIDDPYIKKQMHSMSRKRINLAKKGTLRINGNYTMVSGDPYALAQSMFGMEVTGLLKAGECYHKYWIDKGAKEIVCFRAPMSVHNNLSKLRLSTNPETLHWFRYMETVHIINAWDCTCDRMNGMDFDGDTIHNFLFGVFLQTNDRFCLPDII